MKKVLQCVWLKRSIINSKPKILISACLLGKYVRYDGKIKSYDLSILKDYELIPCCPEVDGGLPTPRAASEIQNDGTVVNTEGKDVTSEFNKGALIALKLAKLHNINIAILKSKSPSCSNKMIYDGTFSGSLKQGKGITVKLLEKHGIKIFDEKVLEHNLPITLF
jgi:uncharacterized protein YbbK (DUF523 family)